MENTISSLKAYLQKMLDEHPNTIEHAVASWLIDYDDPQAYLEDLLTHGCISGIVTDLVYYADTYQFFDTHYRQILDLYYEQDMTVPAQTDIKNYLAWWSFETVARIIANSVSIYC